MKFNSLIPELSVSSIETSKDFYVNKLGFKIEYERKEDKFIFISFEGNQIMLQEINNNWSVGLLEYPFGRGINFEMTVSNVDKFYNNVKASNITLFKDLIINKYRKDNETIIQKEFFIQDPDGYLLRFCD
ncbi:MAG: VOC family protein [Bdellovibrionota bacterium]|nr:VOC family protein [Pseudomonadota bacterium]MDY6090392.1 VOC family protein [Bdellovibrionota bacterium]